MKKRIFHRGYTIENTTGVTNEWKSAIKGNPISGTLTEIKKSVDFGHFSQKNLLAGFIE